MDAPIMCQRSSLCAVVARVPPILPLALRVTVLDIGAASTSFAGAFTAVTADVIRGVHGEHVGITEDWVWWS